MIMSSLKSKTAGKAVEEARKALRTEEERYDADTGQFATKLIGQIRSAEHRLADARADVRKLESDKR
ncbi:hypothetical protein SAZ10_32675 [Mesorhizobium sp. BAC0120]|uniref:hypothetical protein n=1 Tax=Mesorhizobium sp. BAC0120 TaxID=3090670 RepID=UPI00298D22C3|nr:hypothetical protein [Mesorhizobium sp. BAC0120]MDW6026526.1 hypothetical protein [Mesorhizobium sp. BAC0120]